jgi:hypothetical protein
LGTPVTWEQISGARVIVECGFKDIKVTPSQGSHFFQNLTTFRVAYFTVNPAAGEGFLDWEWLTSKTSVDGASPNGTAQPGESSLVHHFRFEQPLVVKIDGRHQRGVILKPGATESLPTQGRGSRLS